MICHRWTCLSNYTYHKWQQSLIQMGHLVCLSLLVQFAYAQDTIDYDFHYEAGSKKITISIEFDATPAGTVNFVIPASGPGTYELTSYVDFVEYVVAYTPDGQMIPGTRGRGSFFVFDEGEDMISRIHYTVDVDLMESSLLGAFASSKRREDYLGVLGYSVFGFLEGLEHLPVLINITTSENWPVFSTLDPSMNRNLGSDQYVAENFALLADAQYLLGPGVEIGLVENSPIPLFVAAYSEVTIDMKEIGRRLLLSLEGLEEYFGYIPMPHYTGCFEFLIPKSPRHSYGFSMEHLNSLTMSLDTSRAIKEYDPNARIGGIVHHMAHSYIPLRSYGEGYRPFEWQTAPLIETIWLNEGFIWYVMSHGILGAESMVFYERIVDSAPDYIKEKSLRELSLLGSTQYSNDFRIGRNLYSRGALLARDLDLMIQEQTNGQKSFKDALLALLHWTEENKRAFQYDEIQSIISNAIQVDISEVWNQWQKAPKD